MGILMLIQLAMNIAGINLVSLLNQVSVWWHIVIVAAVVFLVFLAGKPDASGLTLFAIQPQDVAGSWNNDLGFVNIQYGAAITYPVILAFFFSLLQANWTYTGYDASAHVAEETVGARVASAWGLFLSVAVSAIVGFIFLLALSTHLPDLSTLFPTGPRRRRCRPAPASTTSATVSRSSRSSSTTSAETGRPARGRHRHRDGVLRPVVGGLRRPDAVRVQPRRRPARPRAGSRRSRSATARRPTR